MEVRQGMGNLAQATVILFYLTTVILSVASASLGEALAESKDPY